MLPRRAGWGRAGGAGLVSLTLVAGVLGVLAGMLVASRRASDAPTPVEPLGAYRRPTEIANLYAQAQVLLAKERSEVEALRQKVSEYERVARERSSFEELMSAELERYRATLGLVPLEGPGVVIVLDDSALRGRPEGMDILPLLVHYTDLVMLVNELWTAGAEGIAIDDEPVGPRPSIRSAGRVIYCNGVPVNSPFTITAVGDPDTLRGALEMPGGILEQLRSLGQTVTLEVQEAVHINSLRLTPRLDYARPAPQGPR